MTRHRSATGPGSLHFFRSKTDGGKATDFAQEMADFYTLHSNTVWITLQAGKFYWTTADAAAAWLDEEQ